MKYNIEIFNDDNLALAGVKLDEFQTDIYHNPSWLKANNILQQGDSYYIYITKANNKAYLPLIKREIKNTDCFDLTTPYGYGGIAFNHEATQEFRENALEEIYEYLKNTNCVSLFLRLHPLLNQDLNSNDYSYSNGITLAVDLNRDYQDIYKTYTSGHRYDLRKALKNEDIKIIDDINFEYYDSFINIYTETMHNLKASEFYFFDKVYFYNLKRELGDSLKLIVVKLGDDIIGASLFMLSNGIIQYHLSGTSSEGKNYQPSKLILNYIMEWGVDNQYKFLHLGGGVSGQKDHLHKFKKGFSADEYYFSTVRLITNKNTYKELCKELDYSDEEIVDTSNFFPLYRK